MSERIIWITICIALVIALILVFNRADGPPQQDFDTRNSDLRELEIKIDSMRSVIANMETHLAESPYQSVEEPAASVPAPDPSQAPAAGNALQSYEVRQFRDRGLENPEEDIINDLYNKPDLIPHEGVLGGTMRFHSKDDLTLINSRWAFARYEDGHITGEMLLEYSVNANGTISWNVIRATDL